MRTDRPDELLSISLTRRRLLGGGAAACLTIGLAQALWSQRLLADPRTLEFGRWVESLMAAAERLKRGEITISQWRQQMNALYGAADVPQLISHIDFDQLVARFDFGPHGESFVDLDAVSGNQIPKPPRGQDPITTRFNGIRQGQSVPPHGHANMASAFLVLNGEFRVRQYDKLETRPETVVFRPARDVMQRAGDWNSISETERNIHWLQAMSGDGFYFSIKIKNVIADQPMDGRLCVDLRDPVQHGAGVLEAPIVRNQRAHEIYNGA